jgi:hypothetical protein
MSKRTKACKRSTTYCLELLLWFHIEDHTSNLETYNETIDDYYSEADTDFVNKKAWVVIRVPRDRVKFKSFDKEILSLLEIYFITDISNLIGCYLQEIELGSLDFLTEERSGCMSTGSGYCGTGVSFTKILYVMIINEKQMKLYKKQAKQKNVSGYLPTFACKHNKFTLIEDVSTLQTV